jgi:hypothetical protein
MSDTVLTQTVILLFLLGAAILFRHRRYLGVSRSNLEDEVRPTSSSSSPSDGSCTIKALYIYPIKSCQGIEISRATIVSTGFQHDRQFTFAERKRDGQWRFMTQREYPLLARVRVALDLRRGVVLASWGWWPWERFEVGLEEQGHDDAVLRVRVWKDEPEAWRMPVRLERLGRFLGVRGELALCRVKERRTVLRCAPRKELLGWQPVVGFADAVSYSPLSRMILLANVTHSTHCISSTSLPSTT